MSSAEPEQILKETRNAVYYMQAGGLESAVPGCLILTNLRIAFLEGYPGRRSLLGMKKSRGGPRALINFNVARLMGANVSVKQEPAGAQPGKRAAAEVRQVLIVSLNTPTGPESFSFEVEDPVAWAQLINTFAPTRVEGASQARSAPVQPPSPKTETARAKPVQEAVLEVGNVKFCPECGKELEISARFCWECGSPQPDVD
ncbi:MAG: zinc ribbon domain-containing protein [Candidatus Brockarchaeota archaeon]|nr:zinc ribbon domain-containing protein [Candidatus Brockarchaeota archaeon]